MHLHAGVHLTYIVIFFLDRVIRIGFIDLSMRTIAFEYDMIQKRCYFVFQSADHHFSNSVDTEINDGDIIGFLYNNNTRTCGFTINGIPQRKLNFIYHFCI